MLCVRSNYESYNLHVGDILPIFDDKNEIIVVQADCDELDYIVDTFYLLPLAYHKRNVAEINKVQKWFGDTAKFIYHNLQW